MAGKYMILNYLLVILFQKHKKIRKDQEKQKPQYLTNTNNYNCLIHVGK